MKSNNLIFGIFAGLAAGTLLGLLYAPRKGTETRKRIFGCNDHYVNTLKAEFDELVSRILEEFECSREAAELMVSQGKTVSTILISDFETTN